MRVKEKKLTCVACPKGCEITVKFAGNEILNIEGYSCPQGKEYAREEVISPSRILPTTVAVKGGILPLVPVKTSKPIPVEKILDCMQEIAQVQVEAPVKLGDMVLSNVLDTGADVIATRDLPAKKLEK